MMPTIQLVIFNTGLSDELVPDEELRKSFKRWHPRQYLQDGVYSVEDFQLTVQIYAGWALFGVSQRVEIGSEEWQPISIAVVCWDDRVAPQAWHKAEEAFLHIGDALARVNDRIDLLSDYSSDVTPACPTKIPWLAVTMLPQLAGDQTGPGLELFFSLAFAIAEAGLEADTKQSRNMPYTLEDCRIHVDLAENPLVINAVGRLLDEINANPGNPKLQSTIQILMGGEVLWQELSGQLTIGKSEMAFNLRTYKLGASPVGVEFTRVY